MKTLVLICSLFLVVSLSSGAELENLHGEILALSRQDMVMTVQLLRTSDPSGGRVVTVLLPADMVHLSAAGSEQLPVCLFPGNHVRIRGTVTASDSDSYLADEVRGCGMAACNDPTGVRARLFRKRNNEGTGNRCR
jgi:hypothetical protein